MHVTSKLARLYSRGRSEQEVFSVSTSGTHFQALKTLIMPPRLPSSTLRLTAGPKCSNNGHPSIEGVRSFSASAVVCTRLRRSMWMWLENQGQNFLNPLPGSPNYLGAYDNKGRLKRSKEGARRSDDDVPFPRNPYFRSQPVINEAMREAIWEKIMKDGQTVKAVSAEFGVDMARVGAIVRLKEVEKEWMRKVCSCSKFTSTTTTNRHFMMIVQKFD